MHWTLLVTTVLGSTFDPGWSRPIPPDPASKSRSSIALFDQPRARPAQWRSFAAKETIMFREIRHHVAQWLLYQETLAALNDTPDRMLADAGIRRSEIRQRARRAVQAR
jgi:uncharacterized protein YjiS (DUF1127 family)